MSSATTFDARVVRQSTHWTDRFAHAGLVVVALVLIAFLALPLAAILLQAFEGKSGEFAGFSFERL